VIGLSILSGSHLQLVPDLLQRLADEGVDAPVVVGGIIPEDDRRTLLDAGVAAERITVVKECTGCAKNTDGGQKYFSHRVEQGVAGRMLNVIGIAR